MIAGIFYIVNAIHSVLILLITHNNLFDIVVTPIILEVKLMYKLTNNTS